MLGSRSLRTALGDGPLFGVGKGFGEPVGGGPGEVVHDQTHEALDPPFAEQDAGDAESAGDPSPMAADLVGQRRLVLEHPGVQHGTPLDGVFERQNPAVHSFSPCMSEAQSASAKEASRTSARQRTPARGGKLRDAARRRSPRRDECRPA